MITQRITPHPRLHKHPPLLTRLPTRRYPPLHRRIPRICPRRGAIPRPTGAVGVVVADDGAGCGWGAEVFAWLWVAGGACWWGGKVGDGRDGGEGGLVDGDAEGEGR